MESLILLEAAVAGMSLAKIGACVGAGIAAIGAGIGIGSCSTTARWRSLSRRIRSVLLLWTLLPVSRKKRITSERI